MLRWLSGLNTILHLKDCRDLDSSVVAGWCGHGFKFHLQPFLLTYPEADLAYYLELKIHIRSGDHFADGTACLTAD